MPLQLKPKLSQMGMCCVPDNVFFSVIGVVMFPLIKKLFLDERVDLFSTILSISGVDSMYFVCLIFFF